MGPRRRWAGTMGEGKRAKRVREKGSDKSSRSRSQLRVRKIHGNEQDEMSWSLVLAHRGRLSVWGGGGKRAS